MKTTLKYSLYILVAAGCAFATGCVRRTVAETSHYKTDIKTRNPNRSGPIVEERTYWIWQGSFWNREKQ